MWNQCWLNPFWNHWWSFQSDWLSVVQFIHESHTQRSICRKVKYTFATLQTSSANDSLWRLSHSYVDMDEVRQTSNLIVTTTSLSTQDEIWSQLFLLFLLDSSLKPKIKKLAKAPTTPPETPPESPTLTYTTDPADTTAVHCSDTFLPVVIYVLLCCVCFLCRCCAFFLKRRR